MLKTGDDLLEIAGRHGLEDELLVVRAEEEHATCPGSEASVLDLLNIGGRVQSLDDVVDIDLLVISQLLER